MSKRHATALALLAGGLLAPPTVRGQPEPRATPSEAPDAPTAQGDGAQGSPPRDAVGPVPSRAAGGDGAGAAPAEDPVSPRRATLEARLAKVEVGGQRIERIDRELEALDDEAAVVRTRMLHRAVIGTIELLHQAVDDLLAAEAAGDEVADLRSWVEAAMRDLDARVPGALARRAADVSSLRDELGGAETGRERLEERLEFARERYLNVVAVVEEHVRRLEELGLDASRSREALRGETLRLAELTAERITLDLERAEILAERVRRDEAGEGAAARLGALRDRVQAEVRLLRRLVPPLHRLGVDTTAFRAELFVRTGEVTTDLLDGAVVRSVSSQFLERAANWLRLDGARSVFLAILVVAVLALGRLVAWFTGRVVGASLARARKPRLLQDTSSKIAANVVLLLALVVALSLVGIDVGTLLAGLGIAGFVVGFALQDSIANFFSGMMIAWNRPFDVGDVVDAGGASGTVAAMTLVSTTVLTFDHQTVVVPNRRVWGDLIRNYTAQPTRRVDMELPVPFDADLDRVEAVLREVLAADPRVLEDPAPLVQGNAVGSSGVLVRVRPWVRTEDYWGALWDLTRASFVALEAAGLRVQPPRTDVRLLEAGRRASDAPSEDRRRGGDEPAAAPTRGPVTPPGSPR